jgi:hypothetical protein
MNVTLVEVEAYDEAPRHTKIDKVRKKRRNSWKDE